jgi:hypothetical protein
MAETELEKITRLIQDLGSANGDDIRRRRLFQEMKLALDNYLYRETGTSAGRISDQVEIDRDRIPAYRHGFAIRRTLDEMSKNKSRDFWATQLNKISVELDALERETGRGPREAQPLNPMEKVKVS